jgi:hypothetical protein
VFVQIRRSVYYILGLGWRKTSRKAGVMTFRTLLVTKALVCLIFGVFLLAAPGVLYGLLGGTLSATGMFTAREYGAALIGTLLLTWLAKDVGAFDAKRAILLDLLVYDGIGVIITVAAISSGILNVLGWGIVVVYLLFAAWSGFVLLAGRSKGLSQQKRET